jgi:hypothetical protein
LTKINLPKDSNNTQSSIMSRVLDEDNIELIVNEIKKNNILKPGIIKQTDVNDHLSIIQSNIISITDSIAPIKCIKIKQKDYYP